MTGLLDLRSQTKSSGETSILACLVATSSEHDIEILDPYTLQYLQDNKWVSVGTKNLHQIVVPQQALRVQTF